MGHLQRLLRGVEENEAQIRQLKLDLAAMERTLQNVQSENFGSTDESGGMYFRPGEIRLGKNIILNKDGISFGGGKGILDVLGLRYTDTSDIDLEQITIRREVGTQDFRGISLTANAERGSISGGQLGSTPDTMNMHFYTDRIEFTDPDLGTLILVLRASGATFNVPFPRAYFLERAFADGDSVNQGQVWVKNTSPNELWFTDGEGVDYQVGLTAMGGVHAPDVSDALTVGEVVTVTIA